MVVLNGKTIACGGLLSGVCLQFDNPNGKLSASYGLPWDQNNDVAAVNDDLALVGQWNGGSNYAIARFNVKTRQMLWGFSVASRYAKFEAVNFNQNMQQIVAVGNNDDQNIVVAGFNKDSGKLSWGYTYRISGLKSYIADVDAISQSNGYCLTGYVTDPSANHRTDLLMMRVNPSGILYAIQRLNNHGGSMRVNRIAIDPVSGDAVIVGVSYPAGDGPANAFISRLYNGFFINGFSWANEFSSNHGAQFTDVVIDNDRLFVLGSVAGLSSDFNKLDMIVMQFNIEKRTAINAVRISGPHDMVCNSLVKVETGLRIGCNVNDQATLFSLNTNTFAPSNLPPGYTWHDDALNAMKPVINPITLLNVPLAQISRSAVLSPDIMQPLTNRVISSPLFTQSWPENLPSARPTHAPVLAPSTLLPSAEASSTPSTQPSSEPSSTPSDSPTAAPSISSRPTGQPSSSSPTRTFKPVSEPTIRPTAAPSKHPTRRPTTRPNHVPSQQPSLAPSVAPTLASSNSPSHRPTESLSVSPTRQSSRVPTRNLTVAPTINASSEYPTFFDRSNRSKNRELEIGVLVGLTLLGSGLIVLVVYCVPKHRDIKIAPEADIENQLNNVNQAILLVGGAADESGLPVLLDLTDSCEQKMLETSQHGAKAAGMAYFELESDVESPTPSMYLFSSTDSCEAPITEESKIESMALDDFESSSSGSGLDSSGDEDDSDNDSESSLGLSS